MGPKHKKSPKNAFSFFLDEYVENLREKGRNVSHRIAAEECGLLWTELSEEEKEKYNKLAEHHKANRKVDKTLKFTCTGISFAQLEAEQAEQKKKVEQANKEIKTTVLQLDKESLKTQLFYIIHFNYFCKTTEGIYVPGEVAIAEFSLGDGVRRTYHTLINPGSIPLGYAYEAKETINTVHGLPYPPFEEGESNLLRILGQIFDFLEPGKLSDGSYSPLYTIENNIKACENILKSWIESANECDGVFRVYHLPKLLFWLKNKCVQFANAEDIGFPALSSAESEIDKDIFCYVPGISCEFHVTEDDKYHNCSLSVVQRLVYLICDHCCQYINVEIIPGKHCRLKSDSDKKTFRTHFEKSHFAFSQCREDKLEGESSCSDNVSTFEWKKKGESSSLPGEVQSKFSDIQISSGPSGSSRNVTSSASTGRRAKSKKKKEEDEDNGSSEKFLPFGRGSLRF